MLERLVAQRGLIGWLGILGLMIGGVLCLASENQQGGLGGSLFRAGVVLGSLWLALPDRIVPGARSFSIWQGLGFLSITVAVVRRPWIVLPVLIILGVLSLFTRPRA